jgi:hypothetical protein
VTPNKIMTSCNSRSLHSKLAHLLLEDALCSDFEESQVIAELILDVEQDRNVVVITDETSTWVKAWTDHDRKILANIVEYVAIEGKQAEELYAKLSVDFLPKAYEENQHKEDEEDNTNLSASADDGFDYDETEYLQDGECELCDRYIKLTKHHLIPKETWPRIQRKLLRAAEEQCKGAVDKALIVLGPGLTSMLGRLSPDRSKIREILHETCSICRQCHSAVHRVHCNMELALHYNTVDKLLEDGDIRKFCRWVSKQPASKHTR